MQRRMGKASGIFAVLAIVAGMGFGAREAFATETAFSCTYSPPSRLGACTSTPECDNWCVNDWGGVRGTCIFGCCFCEI